MPRDDDRPRRPRRRNSSSVLPTILIVFGLLVMLTCGVALIPLVMAVREVKGTVDEYQARKDDSARRGAAGLERKREVDAEKAVQAAAVERRRAAGPTPSDQVWAASAASSFDSWLRSTLPAKAYETTTPAFRARTTEAQFASLLTPAERAERSGRSLVPVPDPFKSSADWTFTYDSAFPTRTARVTLVLHGGEWLVDRVAFVPK